MSNKPTVYFLADRGNFVFFHWFTYVIAGLYDFSHLPKPIKFHTNITQAFQRETLELLKPDYEFVENIDGYNVIHHEGAVIIDRCNVAPPYYHFVRNQILVKNNLEYKGTPFRRIYISRSRAHLLSHHGGDKKRHMIDEHIIIDKLKSIGFESIYLEDYNLFEKIKLFQESSVIISPNGGALTVCYFANKNSTIIHIEPTDIPDTQYSTICKTLSIPMISYGDIRCIDADGNTNMPEFWKFKPSWGSYNMEIIDYDDFLAVAKIC